MSGPDPAEPQQSDAVAGLGQAEVAPAADPFAPTAAGPDPEPIEPAVPVTPLEPTPVEPTPTVGAAEATFSQPAGSALFDAQPVDPHPEKLVGAAFAGGLVAAVFLKSLARRKHR